jgi:polar amino acid transport system substrate-binding protein
MSLIFGNLHEVGCNAINKKMKTILFVFYAFLFLAGQRARADEITLVAENDWYPYSAVRHGEARGLAVDLVRAAYAEVGVTVHFKSEPYARCLQETKIGLELGCFDTLSGASLTRDFLFHQVPIFRGVIGIYTLASRSDRTIQVADLKGHRIGITHGYTYGNEVENDPLIMREVAPSDLMNLRKLLRGRSEYSLVYTRIVDYLSAAYPNEFNAKLRQVGVLSDDRLFVSFSRVRSEAPRYAELLDKGLKKIQANGTYARIEEKWRTPEL